MSALTLPSQRGSDRVCNLCGEEARVHLEGPPRIVACEACGILSLASFPDRAVLEASYQEEYYSRGKGERFAWPFELALGLIKRLRLRSILRRAPGPGRILDVGCGRGDLLQLFQKRGWMAVGTQISLTAAQAARTLRGVDVIVGELPELTFPEGSFDVITFFHVLEHLAHPEAYLKRACELLKDDGLLVVEVPDCGSLGFRWLGLRNLCLDYPHHLVFFTRSSLGSLLNRCGLRVEGASDFSLEYSPFTTLQNLLNFLPGEPNRLYRALMGNREGAKLRRAPVTLVHFLLAALLALPAFAISLGGALFGDGNTLRLYCRKAVSKRAPATGS